MQKPSLGWQSWSPPYPTWHGYPRWDYSPFPINSKHDRLKSSRPLKSKLIYWCSWYAHDTRINNQIIQNTVSVIKRHHLPFTHILIDDGWTKWGDWLTPDSNKFPSLRSTIAQIHKNGYMAGLWISPFLAASNSKLYHDHPDWFIKHNNRPIQGLKTMPIWEALIPQRYILDYAKAEVRIYTKEYLNNAIKNWGVDLLKLDFLYAPYFDPNHQSPHVASGHLNWLLTYIKKNYPNIITIACGAPFKDASHLVDAIRVSKDTALPPYVPKFINKIVYDARIKMLNQSLKAKVSPKLNLDPDVRMFNLDTAQTSLFWDTIQTPIIGVGDNLLQLNEKQIKKLKLWLKNLSSRS